MQCNDTFANSKSFIFDASYGFALTSLTHAPDLVIHCFHLTSHQLPWMHITLLHRQMPVNTASQCDIMHLCIPKPCPSISPFRKRPIHLSVYQGENSFPEHLEWQALFGGYV
jgi:hypothetical protein